MMRTLRTDTRRFELYLPKIVETSPEDARRGCEDCSDDEACPNCKAEHWWMDNS